MYRAIHQFNENIIDLHYLYKHEAIQLLSYTLSTIFHSSTNPSSSSSSSSSLSSSIITNSSITTSKNSTTNISTNNNHSKTHNNNNYNSSVDDNGRTGIAKSKRWIKIICGWGDHSNRKVGILEPYCKSWCKKQGYKIKKEELGSFWISSS